MLCKQRIEKDTKSKLVVIDGIRNVNEFFEFKKLGTAIWSRYHTTPARRFKFLQARARSDSPQTFQSFDARDRRELTVGIGEAIALSDEVIVNTGSVADKGKGIATLQTTETGFQSKVELEGQDLVQGRYRHHRGISSQAH